MRYRADHFAPTFTRAPGRELWQFLNRSDNVLRMETASELRYPAIAGIERPLVDKFGTPIRNLRVKQMIGHMVRQIMERRGFVLDASRVNVTTGGLFATGSRYRRVLKPNVG